jgi:histidinol dehydrogenase
LEIVARDPERTLASIRNAGAVFLGPFTPVAVGDYVAGPSHTLPTGGAARFAGALSANTFRKAMSVARYDRERLQEVRSAVGVLADVEGLDAHKQSVEIRFD